MRYAADHKSQSRQRILAAASRQLRGKGPGSIAVGQVTAEAGLTHGAFYAHFPSKKVLVAEAIESMFETAQPARGRLAEALADEHSDMRAALRAFLGDYLSPRHRDGAERGCPLPALAADMARSDGAPRERFAAGMARIITRIEAALARIGTDRPGAEASTIVAQMVGAVAVARALGAGPRSDAILRDSLAALIERYAL